MASIPKRRLFGNTLTTVIGFGGGASAGDAGGYAYGAVSESEAIATLEHAYAKGIRLFDTAPCYGFGASEQRLGKALASHSAIRSQLVIVSKGGVTWKENKRLYTDNSPGNMRRMLEQSLKDLCTDYLDLYLIHWPDHRTPVEDTMETLMRAKEEGLIRAIGASNFGVEWFNRAQKVGPIEVLQNEFNAFNQHNAANLFPTVREKNLGFMSYGTIAKGLLAGTVKADRQYEVTDIRSKFAFVKRQAQMLDSEIKEFLDIARELSTSGAALAAAWVLSHNEVSTALCGSKDPAQVDDVLRALQFELSDEIKARISRISERATPRFLEAMK